VADNPTHTPLGRLEQEAPAVTPELDNDGHPQRPNAAGGPVPPVFDRVRALVNLVDDEELLQMAIALHLDEEPQIWRTIEAAIESGQGEELRKVAHALKGSLHTLGAAPAGDAAAVLERQSGGSKVTRRVAARALRLELDRLEPLLRAERKAA